MKAVFFPFLIALLFLSCKKDPIQFTIKGTINDQSFEKGLSLANIDLYEVKVGSTIEKHIATTNSDDNGNYSFTFNRDEAEKYYIKVSKENYFDTEKEIYFSSLSTDKDNTVDVNIEAVAQISWLIKNTGQADSSDVLKIQKLNGKTDCPTCCANTFYNYTGALVNDTLTCTVAGNSYLKFYLIENTGSGQSSNLDSVFCTAFQTTTYPVNY